MAAPYKIPGVYVEEIPKLPPSIAPVETAIPAFIGYTEKAMKIAPDDLLNIPTKIGSFAEYELYFGEGASLQVSSVRLNDDNSFKSATVNNLFYMYDSLRLFYANGGGDCYIVSTGLYGSAGKVDTDFTDAGKGLKTLEKVDEPTILVFPDNSLLNDTHFNSVYQAALSQCGDLMDRVALMHVKEDDPHGTAFRSGIGINNLKYGASYSPWLNVSFPKNITYRDFKTVITKGASSYTLDNFTTDSGIQGVITGYNQVIADVNTITTASTTLSGLATKTLRERYNELESAYLAGKTPANMQALMNFLFSIAREVDALVGASGVTNTGLKGDLKTLITSTLKDIYNTLISYDKELVAEVTGSGAAGYSKQYDAATAPAATEWGAIFGASAPAASSVIPDTETNKGKQMDAVRELLPAIFDSINNAWISGVVNTAKELEKSKHKSLLENFPFYKIIIEGIRNTASTVPPSGAIAGLYAFVDRTRGVWKAPANVSVNNIVGPKDTFTSSELAALNVDANGGKSINAIRSFTGKGTLVYGARTLAGNDNEWRYISVRRFFNFVEESTKKATEQFVFEPNDANTWVRVQGMIENFLTYLWRQGALQGIKPEHAFYVAVGLGKTMTAIDILEGRMSIEIGMAVVRPAEFIILKFSHKMAES